MIQDMELRPLSFGELLDRSLRLYRRNFWKFLGISAIVQVPVAILSLIVLSTVFQDFFAILENPEAVTDFGTSSALTTNIASNLNAIVSSIFVQLANAAMVLAVTGALFGRNLSFSDAYRQVFKRWQSLLGTAFLTIVAATMLVFATIILILTIVGWVAGLGALIFFSVAVSSLIVPVIMLEKANAWDTIPRAWNLARRHFWRILGFFIVLSLLVSAFSIGPAALVVGLLTWVTVDGSMNTLSTSDFLPAIITGVIGTTLLGVFVVPLRITAMTLFYLDVRVRDEGLDLVMATAPEESDPFELLALAPRNQNESLMRGKDFGRYFLLGLALFGLYILLVAVTVGIIFAFASAFAGF